MQRILSTILIIIASLVFTSGKGSDALQFSEKTFNFGTISASGGDIVHRYEFVNTSDEPVAVLSVSTGCNCTRPQYPTEPIAAGKSGVITITFQPKGISGQVDKSIIVRYRGAKARSSKRITLRLRGAVTPDGK